MRNHLARMGACYFGTFSFTLEADGLHMAGALLDQRFRYGAIVACEMTDNLLMAFTGETAAWGMPVTDANRAEVEAFHRELAARLPPARR
jgi:hypothetical protein